MNLQRIKKIYRKYYLKSFFWALAMIGAFGVFCCLVPILIINDMGGNSNDFISAASIFIVSLIFAFLAQLFNSTSTIEMDLKNVEYDQICHFAEEFYKYVSKKFDVDSNILFKDLKLLLDEVETLQQTILKDCENAGYGPRYGLKEKKELSDNIKIKISCIYKYCLDEQSIAEFQSVIANDKEIIRYAPKSVRIIALIISLLFLPIAVLNGYAIFTQTLNPKLMYTITAFIGMLSLFLNLSDFKVEICPACKAWYLMGFEDSKSKTEVVKQEKDVDRYKTYNLYDKSGSKLGSVSGYVGTDTYEREKRVYTETSYYRCLCCGKLQVRNYRNTTYSDWK
ncbi:MAG: hypothetical protein K2M75_03390 [Clostridia bacterium]|nr:hypothetical protein [Clostridia bacterium]